MTLPTPTALVADDDETLRILLCQALANWGFDVMAARDGREAQELAGKRLPDVIFMDLMMPVLDGYQASRAIRQLSDGLDIPIIVVTGHEDLESIETAYEAGVTDFITKPINWALLKHRLQFVLRASRVRRELRASEQRYALAAQGANDGLWDWDLVHSNMHYSLRWKQMLGLENQAVSEDPSEWFRRVHPDDLPRLQNELEIHLSGQSGHFENEHRMIATDGSYHWMLCRGLAVRDDCGQPVRMAGSNSDITRRKAAEAQLAHDASHDALTGLPNRMLFTDRLQHAIGMAQRRPDYAFAVLFMDIDRFKVINDSLGHRIGDQVILVVAARISACTRDNATLARLGGDEFTLLIHDIGGPELVTELIDRIQNAVAEPLRVDSHDLRPSLSIGVAFSSDNYQSADEMLRDSDTAMYRAKKMGKGHFAFFDGEMHMQALNTLLIEAELRTGLATGQFILRYQPIVCMGSLRTVGVEALLRWQHPQRGELVPADFLSSAEDSGLIVPLGRWVLREACRQMKAWEQAVELADDWFVSINCSSREFAQPSFVSDLEKSLAESRLSAARLRIEITEQVIAANRRLAEAKLREIRGLGIRIGIDDFGSASSTLNGLENLPIDYLKIDRSFLHAPDRAHDRFELMKAVVDLVHKLEMSVVGEGNETGDEVARLKRLSCEFGQGNYFLEAVRAEEVIPLILHGSGWTGD
ncbi:MAG: EAL domain-containing protein [Methylococcaceae bacterium]|nr:EAL domain-containing protein [Methylococcaceae bacterium]